MRFLQKRVWFAESFGFQGWEQVMVDLHFPLVCEVGQHNGNVGGRDTISSGLRSRLSALLLNPEMTLWTFLDL